MLPAKSPRMARYKHIDTSPRFLAVDLEKQLLPGSLAHAVNHLLDHDVDLSGFDVRYRNDAAGASNPKGSEIFTISEMTLTPFWCQVNALSLRESDGFWTAIF